MYMKWSKCNLYAKKIECLGHIIADKGIHPDVDKLSQIREWRTPQNYNDVQQFVGLVNYIGNFLPNVTRATTSHDAKRITIFLETYSPEMI